MLSKIKKTRIFNKDVHMQFCPSVRPSHGWISQKRCKLGSPNFHRRLPGRLQSFRNR